MTYGQTMHTLPGSSQFPTTRWTLVVAAGAPDRKEARSALVSLCEGYWYPLYAYLRRRGYLTDQAQDLTQDFFMRVLEGRYLDRADRGSGQDQLISLLACEKTFGLLVCECGGHAWRENGLRIVSPSIACLSRMSSE